MKKQRFVIVSVLLITVFACGVLFFACDKDEAAPNLEASFFAEWQNYIADDARVMSVATPGSHDSGTVNIGNNDAINKLAETQGADIYTQLTLGSRYFDVRVNVGTEFDEDGGVKDKNALKIFHSFINFGMTFEKVLDDINRFFDEYSGQFIILDFQHFDGGVEPRVREMIEDKLDTDDHCVKNTESISSLTMGDVRRNGYRYIIVWGSDDLGDTDYIFPRNSALKSPYDGDLHYYGPQHLIEVGFLNYFSVADQNKFFVLQAQLTASLLSNDEGVVSDSIKNLSIINNEPMNNFILSMQNDARLEKINIVMRDYLELDQTKQKVTLCLNLSKRYVKSEYIALFEKMTAV